MAPTTVSIIKKYRQLELGQPVLVGHILSKIDERFLCRREIVEWANDENEKNGFPKISESSVAALCRKFKKWRRSFKTNEVEDFEKFCDLEMHSKTGRLPVENKTCTGSSSTTPTYIDASTNTESFTDLHKQNKRLLRTVQQLKSVVKNLKSRLSAKKSVPIKKKKKIKQINKKIVISDIDSRKLHYMCKLNNMATTSVPPVLKSIYKTFGISGKLFSATTVFRMTIELGFISDFLTADAVLKATDATLIFDATTRDGDHINNVMLSTSETSCVVSIQQLPGGTAQDYTKHITESIDRLAFVHSVVTNENCNETRSEIINKIKACLTDRAAVNRATLYLLELSWNKNIIELNCNIHPLEAISRNVCLQLKPFEDSSVLKLPFSLKDCIGHVIIMKMSSLRYCENEGLVKELKHFLIDNFSNSLILRYRGNRINIIFHLGYIYYVNRNLFLSFLNTYSQSKTLCKDLAIAFENDVAYLQLKVFGIIGKLFSGPWMSTFYTPLKDQHTVTDGIILVKSLVDKLNVIVQDPIKVLDRTTDFFGNHIDFDEGMTKLMSRPSQRCELFTSMMKAGLQAIIDVLQRQYMDSFEKIDSLRGAALTSARLHTMEAESVFGQYTAGRSFSSCLDTFTISNLIKAKRNRVLEVLHDKVELSRKLIKLAIRQGKAEQTKNSQYKKEVQKEVTKRICNKKKSLEQKTRKKLEFELIKLESSHPTLPYGILIDRFPDYPELRSILLGNSLFKNISHIWNVDNIDKLYKGTIIKYENDIYTILYFQEHLEEEECEISKYQLGADYINNDITFS